MTTPDTNNNTTAAALRAGQALGEPREHKGHQPYAIVPEGSKLELLEPEAERPNRVVACPTFDDAPSLIAYFNRFKDPASTLFSDTDRSQVVAVLDHHEAKDAPRYHSHRAVFTAKHSPEWLTWTRQSGKPMSQVEFAQFIEDNAPDILTPAGTELLEIATSIEATRSGEFKSKIERSSSSIVFGYSEETNAVAGGGKLEVPKEFSVQLRPYIGTGQHRLVAKLRYKLDSGTLRLWFDLIRAEQLRLAALDAIVLRIKDETATDVLAGRPQ